MKKETKNRIAGLITSLGILLIYNIIYFIKNGFLNYDAIILGIITILSYLLLTIILSRHNE